MNAKEARQKTLEHKESRLPTVFHNVEFDIKQACRDGFSFVTLFIPSDFYYATQLHFEELGYTVTSYKPTRLWYKKSRIDNHNMKISW